MMLRLEFYVEEASAEAALIYLVPAILEGHDFEFEIYVFEGKPALLRKLPQRLKAYQHSQDENWRIIVLTDRDDEDCHEIKQKLEAMAHESGLITKSRNPANFRMVNRIAVEELEAWFFGDIEAIMTAYPGVPETLNRQVGYRDPDAIRGGTWEKLERVLIKHHPGGLEKIRAAEEISQHMRPERNQSRSFQVFRDALIGLFK